MSSDPYGAAAEDSDEEKLVFNGDNLENEDDEEDKRTANDESNFKKLS